MDNPPELLLLKEVITDFGNFDLLTSFNGVEGYLTVRGASEEICTVLLEELFEENGISEGLDDKALSTFCRDAQENGEWGPCCLAKGTPPQEGTNGHLVFLKRPSDPQQIQQSGDAKINHREVHKFDNIHAGDHVATLVASVAGESGVDLFGKVIPVAKVQDSRIIAGENVSFDAKTGEFTALANGHLVQKQRTLSVLPVYQAQKDLDMHHGNIRFIGTVEVGRDVLDDFQVVSAKDIIIGGTAEACQLTAGGDITIRGGVTGKGRGRIRAKGTVTARYLNEADVICDGDVIVEKEIVNSSVSCLGRLIVQNGSILGSEVVALKGVQVRDAGSELGIKTTIAVGVHYRFFKELRELGVELLTLCSEQEKNLRILKQWLEGALTAEAFDKRRHRQIEASITTSLTDDKRLQTLLKQAGKLQDSFRKDAIACISIERHLYESVTAIVGLYEFEFQELLKGPLSLVPDHERRLPVVKSGLLIKALWKQQEDQVGSLAPESTTIEVSLEEIEALYAQYCELVGAARTTGKTVLIAEDQANMRMLIKRHLVNAGYDVLEASNGREALALMVEHQPTCCLLDLIMPKVDGFSVLKAMRANEALKAVPVFICAASSEREHILKAHKSGIAGYFVKPLNMEEILKAINTVCLAEKADDNLLQEGV